MTPVACKHLDDMLGCQDELAACVTLEQGKTLPDAHGDVFRGLGALLPLRPPQQAHGLPVDV